jgi:hypothetical protein
MQTIDQYFPAMSETKGRLFCAPRGLELGILAAALAVALSGGVGVPLYQEHAQQVKFDEANAPVVAALKATQASIDHIEALAASAEPGTAQLAHTYVENIQARLKPIHTVSVAQAKADLDQQQQAYAQAQDLIAHSPYKDHVGLGLFGKSAEEKAYDQARMVQKPAQVTDLVMYAMDQAQQMARAAESVRIYAASDEQAIATMTGAQAPKSRPVAVQAPAPVAASAPPAPPVAQVSAPAITTNTGNNSASDNAVNIGLFGARSPAAPKVEPKTPVRTAQHREPTITQSKPIVRTPTVAPAPRRPAESNGYFEQ